MFNRSHFCIRESGTDKPRTRIVVTQPEKSRLQHFDRLLLFEDGCIVEMGPPAEVMAAGHPTGMALAKQYGGFHKWRGYPKMDGL